MHFPPYTLSPLKKGIHERSNPPKFRPYPHAPNLPPRTYSNVNVPITLDSIYKIKD